jgi:hypothetical protein
VGNHPVRGHALRRYLYARWPGPAIGALLVLGSRLLSTDLAIETGVSALDARGLALVVWFLPQLVFGEGLLPAEYLGFSGLTLLLGGGYAAVVLGLSELLGQDSSLVVAAAT